MLEQVLIKLDYSFVLWSFPLGKDELVVILKEVTLERTQLDLKEPLKGNLITYESYDIKLLVQPCVPALNSFFT